MMAPGPTRTIKCDAARRIAMQVTNRSSHYAAYWLALIAGEPGAQHNDADIHIVGAPDATSQTGSATEVRVWDYQVGYDGCGEHASAISGAATVIGKADGEPIPLPLEMPEKWCGLLGATLALAECWAHPEPGGKKATYDVSSADVLRAFCLQNSGGPSEMAHSWRRNGRLCIEHGGIFPMGFFRCGDGHVAILGRSRRDWKNIQAAIGSPDWAALEAFEDPFAVARDSAQADALLEQSLAAFSRDELLASALAHGAVIAPVYTRTEAEARGVFRAGFIGDDRPRMPFLVHQNDGDAANTTHDGAERPADKKRTSVAGQPLAGLRVIELAWIWSGPMVGQLLAELGAEVIKVEWATRFDLYRTRGLEAMRGKMDEATRIESSIYFHSLNRNKTSLSVDLKTEAGRRAIKELAATSHVLIENFTVGTMARLGLGSDELAKANPALVQLSMSGAGRGSSVEQIRSYGLVLSALAGAEAPIEADGEFVGSPTFSISDPNAALFATFATLAAVHKARETGAGMVLDLSQIEAAATLAGTPSIDARRHDTRRLQNGRYAIGSAAVLQLEETDAAPEFSDCSGWLAADHPVTGPEELVAAPWRINGARPPLHAHAPALGSGNVHVLGGILGWSQEQVRAMEAM